MPPDNSAKADSLLRWAFILCIICLAIFQFSENTADPDLWGHVIYGNHLLETGQLMRADPYSWTAPGHEWINHEIIAEGLMALSFRVLGGPGLLLLTVAVGLLTFFVALSTASKNQQPITKIAAWAFGALAVVEISFGFAARPQIFTALALAAEIWLLCQIHRGKWKWAITLPVLFVLWINTHGGAIVGIVLLFAAVGATTAQSVLVKSAPALGVFRLENPPSARAIIILWIIAIISTAALLANPYGFGLIRWLIDSITWLRPQIAEWNPVTLGWDHAAFFFCVALAAFAFLFSRRPRQLWEIAVLALLAAMAFRSIRNTPLFCVAALALVPSHLANALERFQNQFAGLVAIGRQPMTKRILTAIFSLLVVAILLSTLFLHKQRAWTMEVPRAQYPVSAIQFIQQHDLHGNLLVFFDWGEMCLWELPDSHVSIDGRLDTCYPADVITAHWQLYNADPFDTNSVDINRADFVLLPGNLAGSLALAKNDGWHPVYFDDLAVVLVKNLGQFQELAGLKLPVDGGTNAIQGRAAFPNVLPPR
ncbi:MAG TPA: hypothetical protein VGI03_15285 [Verrucomicrobiae bacterium]|jgi:hypothetical protein